MKTEKSNKMTAQEAIKKLKDFSSSFEMLGCESGIVAVTIEALEKQIGVSDMERLTMTSDKGGGAFTFDLDITCKPSEAQKILKMAKKLKSYEDAEEQGLLLRFPCKVGTKVYLIRCDSVEVIKCAVARFIIGDQVKNVRLYIIKDDRYTEVPLYQFNKTVFLTKEEAEQALARMGKENE